jgi:hypothetical protein
MTFATVFDVAQSGYTTWWFPAHGLIFVGVGVLFVCWPALVLKVMPIKGPDLLDFLELLYFWPVRARKIFGWIFLSLAMLWTVTSLTGTYGEYRTMVAALHDGRCAVVEGRITDFVSMPGRPDESFVVGDRRFAYSDDIVTAGFHNTRHHGGPIREGLYVRVTYFGNSILRLEVRV